MIDTKHLDNTQGNSTRNMRRKSSRFPQLGGLQERPVDASLEGMTTTHANGGSYVRLEPLPQILICNEEGVQTYTTKRPGVHFESPYNRDTLIKDAVAICPNHIMDDTGMLCPVQGANASTLDTNGASTYQLLDNQPSQPEDTEGEHDVTFDVDVNEPVRSSSEVYLGACSRLHVVPSRQITERLGEQLLPLNHLNLAGHGVTALSVALVHNTTVTSLQLSENSIGERGLSDLCTALTRNITITNLNVSENNLGLKGARIIAKFLMVNKTLVTLNLSGNAFKDAGISYIARALKKNRGLKSLILSHNHIEERSGSLLGDALGENEYLQNLDLRWNHLRLKGALAFIRALKENTSLRTLDLSWNGFSDPGARAVGQYLADNDTLQEIDLTANRIHLEGATALARGIKKNSTLKVIKLSKNPIASKGACQILEAISLNEDSQVHRFDIVDIEINPHFEALFAEVCLSRTLEVKHGGLVTDDPYGQPARRTPATMGDPAALLYNYAKSSGLRLIDLFAQLDVDNSSSVSHEEFKIGMKRSGLPLSDMQIEKLITHLDVDGDGEIDFRELVEGQRGFRDRERRRQRATSPYPLAGDRTITPGSDRTLQGSSADTHVPTPRVASPRLAMDSPLGKSTLIYSRRESYHRGNTQLPPTWEDGDFSP